VTPGRDAGTLTGPASSPAAAAKRGTSAEQAEIERLRRQNEHLAADLARNGGLEDHGKTHAFLQLLSENADHDPKSSR
jgi:hypothetical protein